MKNAHIDLYNELIKRPNIVCISLLGNPIEVGTDTVKIYAFSRGKICTGYIDSKDLEKIKINRTWCIEGYNSHRKTAYFSNGHVTMHDLIMQPPDGMVVDHINGNGLDNRRCNLRVVSHRINMLNRRKHSNNTTGMTNVHITKKGIYQVAVMRKFYSQEIAQAAADEVATVLNRYAIQDDS